MKQTQNHPEMTAGTTPNEAVIADPPLRIAPTPAVETKPELEQDAGAASFLMTIIDSELSHLRSLLASLEKESPEGNEANEARALLHGLEGTKVAVAPYINKGKMPPAVSDNARAQIRAVANFLVEHGEDEETTAHGARVLETLEAEHKKQVAKKKTTTKTPVRPTSKQTRAEREHAAAERHAMEKAETLGIIALHKAAPARHRAHEIDIEAQEDHVEHEREEAAKKARKKTPRIIGTMRTINNAASHVRGVLWSSTALIGTTQHARNTAYKLEESMRTAQTNEEYNYYLTEAGDAVARHLVVRTFIDQEIEKQVGELQRIGFHVTDQEDVIRQLIANDAFTADRRSWFYTADYNAAWSDENVKRIDMNADGQISASELSVALSDPDRALRVAKASRTRAEALAKGLRVPEGVIYVEGSVVSGGNRRYDRNGDGKIDGTEFRDILIKAGRSIGSTDHNHDGKVDGIEMGNSLLWLEAQAHLAAAQNKKSLDKNHDGKVSADELFAALHSKGVTFNKIDSDAEFRQVLEQIAPTPVQTPTAAKKPVHKLHPHH